MLCGKNGDTMGFEEFTLSVEQSLLSRCRVDLELKEDDCVATVAGVLRMVTRWIKGWELRRHVPAM